MIHDVIFNYGTNKSKSAYDNWDIILTKVTHTLPDPKTTLVDIKGADGFLDLSEAETGDIKYKNRKLSLTFELMNVDDYDDIITDMSNNIHGRMMNLMLTSDPDYYYEGRATINKWECSKRKGTVTINLDAYPFKKSTTEYNFEITKNTDAVVTKYIYITTRKPIMPYIVASGNLVLNGVTLETGKYRYPDILLNDGVNSLEISGVGTIKILYRTEVL